MDEPRIPLTEQQVQVLADAMYAPMKEILVSLAVEIGLLKIRLDELEGIQSRKAGTQ